MIPRSAFVFGVILLLLSSGAIAQQDDRVGREVVSRLFDALARYDKVDLSASIRTRVSIGPGTENGPLVEATLLKVKQFRTRSLISMKSKFESPGTDAAFSQNDFILYDSGDVLSCQASLDSSLRQVDGVTSSLGFLLYSKRLAGKQRLDKRSMFTNLNDAGAALWIVGYAPLRNHIDEASELTITPTDDGAEIHSRSEYGRLSLTLAKSSGWLPRSIQLTKGPEHKTIGGLVRDVYGSSGANPVTSIKWIAEFTDFTRDNDGRYAPKHATVLRQEVSEAGIARSETTTIELDRVIFDPPLTASDFRTEIVAPVDYPVTVNEASHLPFKWDGEAAVPGVPIDPERIVESLAGSGGGKRTLLIALNVALVLVLALLFWRKRAAS